jgi:protein SCO1/2
MWWCLLGLFLASCSQQEKFAFVGSVVSGMRVDGAVELSGSDGKLHRLVDFKGKVVALFFGYTHCPDVCPTAMSELNRALKLLGPRAKEVQVVFVTLDPERDTVDVLRRYVPYFNPDFIGLRGEVNVTKKLAQEFKVFYARQASDSKTGYTIDHSSGVYVFDRNGDLRLFLNQGQTVKDVAHDLQLLLDEK